MDDGNPVFSRRLVRYGLIWGVWTVVALFFCTQVLVMSSAQKQPVHFRDFFFQASTCYLWALATPVVLWLSRRYCLERHNWGRRAALHFGTSVLLTSALLVTHICLYMIIMGQARSLSWFRVFNFTYFNLDKWMLIYWLIFGMSHAFSYYNSFRKGELKASELRTQLVQSQLEALKMQVHPHFLFNTLHSISALLSKDTEAALGPKFDQKRFHDFLLAQGLLPPDLMRKAVMEDFVPAEKKRK